MFKTFIGNFWNIVFTILIYSGLWLVLLVFGPKILLGILAAFVVSLFFIKWWK